MEKETGASLSSEVDRLDYKYKECIAYLIKMFQSLEEENERKRIGVRSYGFLTSLEKIMMDAGEDAYIKYIEEKNEKKMYECIDLMFDLADDNEGLICYYHNRRGIEGGVTGNLGVLWNVLIQCVSEGLEECGRSVEDLVWELRNER